MPGWYFKDRISTLGDLVEALEALEKGKAELHKAEVSFERSSVGNHERNRMDVKRAKIELDDLLAVPIIPENQDDDEEL